MVILSGLPHAEQVQTILTASPEALKTARGILNRAKARSRPKVMRPCPKCAAVMGARELQRHKCKTPDADPTVCSECGGEMIRYDAAIDTGKSGIGCLDCGWSWDD
jgi:ssDNA-binding Zn-finger/Zn-ribbon topoisomerase 1